MADFPVPTGHSVDEQKNATSWRVLFSPPAIDPLRSGAIFELLKSSPGKTPDSHVKAGFPDVVGPQRSLSRDHGSVEATPPRRAYEPEGQSTPDANGSWATCLTGPSVPLLSPPGARVSTPVTNKSPSGQGRPPSRGDVAGTPASFRTALSPAGGRPPPAGALLSSPPDGLPSPGSAHPPPPHAAWVKRDAASAIRAKFDQLVKSSPSPKVVERALSEDLGQGSARRDASIKSGDDEPLFLPQDHLGAPIVSSSARESGRTGSQNQGGSAVAGTCAGTAGDYGRQRDGQGVVLANAVSRGHVIVHAAAPTPRGAATASQGVAYGCADVAASHACGHLFDGRGAPQGRSAPAGHTDGAGSGPPGGGNGAIGQARLPHRGSSQSSPQKPTARPTVQGGNMGEVHPPCPLGRLSTHGTPPDVPESCSLLSLSRGGAAAPGRGCLHATPTGAGSISLSGCGGNDWPTLAHMGGAAVGHDARRVFEEQRRDGQGPARVPVVDLGARALHPAALHVQRGLPGCAGDGADAGAGGHHARGAAYVEELSPAPSLLVGKPPPAVVIPGTDAATSSSHSAGAATAVATEAASTFVAASLEGAAAGVVASQGGTAGVPHLGHDPCAAGDVPLPVDSLPDEWPASGNIAQRAAPAGAGDEPGAMGLGAMRQKDAATVHVQLPPVAGPAPDSEEARRLRRLVEAGDGGQRGHPPRGHGATDHPRSVAAMDVGAAGGGQPRGEQAAVHPMVGECGLMPNASIVGSMAGGGMGAAEEGAMTHLPASASTLARVSRRSKRRAGLLAGEERGQGGRSVDGVSRVALGHGMPSGMGDGDVDRLRGDEGNEAVLASAASMRPQEGGGLHHGPEQEGLACGVQAVAGDDQSGGNGEQSKSKDSQQGVGKGEDDSRRESGRVGTQVVPPMARRPRRGVTDAAQGGGAVGGDASAAVKEHQSAPGQAVAARDAPRGCCDAGDATRPRHEARTRRPVGAQRALSVVVEAATDAVGEATGGTGIPKEGKPGVVVQGSERGRVSAAAAGTAQDARADQPRDATGAPTGKKRKRDEPKAADDQGVAKPGATVASRAGADASTARSGSKPAAKEGGAPARKQGAPRTIANKGLARTGVSLPGLQMTRSGRLLLPVLAFWCNQHVSRDVTGAIIKVDPGCNRLNTDGPRFSLDPSVLDPRVWTRRQEERAQRGMPPLVQGRSPTKGMVKGKGKWGGREKEKDTKGARAQAVGRGAMDSHAGGKDKGRGRGKVREAGGMQARDQHDCDRDKSGRAEAGKARERDGAKGSDRLSKAAGAVVAVASGSARTGSSGGADPCAQASGPNGAAPANLADGGIKRKTRGGGAGVGGRIASVDNKPAAAPYHTQASRGALREGDVAGDEGRSQVAAQGGAHDSRKRKAAALGGSHEVPKAQTSLAAGRQRASGSNGGKQKSLEARPPTCRTAVDTSGGIARAAAVAAVGMSSPSPSHGSVPSEQRSAALRVASMVVAAMDEEDSGQQRPRRGRQGDSAGAVPCGVGGAQGGATAAGNQGRSGSDGSAGRPHGVDAGLPVPAAKGRMVPAHSAYVRGVGGGVGHTSSVVEACRGGPPASGHPPGLDAPDSSEGGAWTRQQEDALRAAVASLPPSTRNYWEKVARQVVGKTAISCFSKIYEGHPTPGRPAPVAMGQGAALPSRKQSRGQRDDAGDAACGVERNGHGRVASHEDDGDRMRPPGGAAANVLAAGPAKRRRLFRQMMQEQAAPSEEAALAQGNDAYSLFLSGEDPACNTQATQAAFTSTGALGKQLSHKSNKLIRGGSLTRGVEARPVSSGVRMARKAPDGYIDGILLKRKQQERRHAASASQATVSSDAVGGLAGKGQRAGAGGADVIASAARCLHTAESFFAGQSKGTEDDSAEEGCDDYYFSDDD